MKKNVCLLFCLGFLLASGTVQAGLPAVEAGLNPGGSPFEVNADSQGVLWVSDYKAGQVWAVDPIGSTSKVFPVGGNPSDARHDGTYLWWADAESNILGRVVTSDGSYTRWEAPPGTAGFYGTALDSLGRFWALDDSSSNLYRLEPSIHRLCTLKIPQGGRANYLLRQGDYLWLGDRVNARLLRLNVNDNTYNWWSLPAGSAPFALALSPQGEIWYTDSALNAVASLNPLTSAHISYALPQPGTLLVPTVLAGRVWFTRLDQASLGALDPGIASWTPHTPQLGSGSITPACDEDIGYSTGGIAISSGSLTWAAGNYPTLVDANGWRIYQLPDTASPWGIAAADSVYYVDNFRKVLGKIPVAVQVTACKLMDADGSLATTNDRTPKLGWPVYLRIAGVRQLPGRLTGADGCAVWSGLPPGPAYGVDEDAGGAAPLTPTSHEFGPTIAGQVYSFTFINKNQQGSLFYIPLVRRP